jgi:hypothetical protein
MLNLNKRLDVIEILDRYQVVYMHLYIWGAWRSGSASALHAEGLGFDPLPVHNFFVFVLSSQNLYLVAMTLVALIRA